MEQDTRDTWRGLLNTPTREEQHQQYGGEISEEDFDMDKHYDLGECALRTQKDMCAANPKLEIRWMDLELEWMIHQYSKKEGRYEQDCGE